MGDEIQKPVLHREAIMDVNQTAEWLQVTPPTVRRLVKSGKITAMRTGGKTAGWRFHAGTVLDQLQNRFVK
jgi:excisionase family DNA binding protein